VPDPISMGGIHIGYVMVSVSAMRQATEFLRDVLGLPLQFESPEWTEFATEGATLALHPTETPALPARDGLEPAGGVRIGFNVADLDTFHERMQSHEVPCVQEPKVQFGVKLAQYSGPDGLVFSVGETRAR